MLILFSVSKTSYALFTSSVEGSNTMSIKVGSTATVKLRIAKSNGETASNVKNYKNVVEFDVEEGYIFDSCTCTSGQYSYDEMKDELTLINLEEDSVCTIKYKEGSKNLKNKILGKDNNNIITSGDGLYATNDTNDKSPSYYYKGKVENNYINIPEKDQDAITNALYRIVRINEDSSIRLIREEGIDNNKSYLFNSKGNNYKYMYYSESNIEGGIMKTLNNWYDTVLKPTNLDKMVVETTFCEQAKANFDYDGRGTLGNATAQIVSENYKPTLTCVVDGNGKGLLTMKVGLLDMDEVLKTGLKLYYDASITDYNAESYLQINDENLGSWLMSPAFFSNNKAYISGIYKGVVTYSNADYSLNGFNMIICPVINLSSSVMVTGLGTKEKPYNLILN